MMLKPLGLIAAHARKRAIGLNGELPWHYPEDMKHFRKKTSRHIIIMGKKTFESIGRALPKRRNIVITSQDNFKADKIEIAHSLDEAIKLSDTGKYSEKIPIIIGGAQIYELAMPKVTRMWLTVINKDFKADTYFPPYDHSEWDLIEHNVQGDLIFKTLERKNIMFDNRK